MPSIDQYMTREPYAVHSTASLAHARELMTAHAIRHIPVIDSGALVGVITDSALRAIESIPGVDDLHIEVARVMEPPVTAWGETPLDEVSALMCSRKTDCVVVLGGHGVQGIFTAIDAARTLGELLQRVTE